jgi:hypothetical protein
MARALLTETMFNCIVVFVSIHFMRFVLKTSCVSDFVLLRSTHERLLNGSLWVFMKNAVWNYFVEKLNSWNEINGIPWLCSCEGPRPQLSWKQWMVEHSGVLWPPRMSPIVQLQVWENESSEAVVLDYFKIPLNQHIEVQKCGK